MEEGKKEGKYTSDQDERKRTVVTISGKINTLLLRGCYMNWFDNLMKTFIILCKTYKLQCYKKSF